MKEWLSAGQRYFELTARQWIALVSIPLLLLGLFAYAFRDPVANLDQVPAAVVNEDEPVTVNGQITPLGRELAASLVNADDPNYDWTLTNADDAAAGLASGHYRVVVTIPRNFSADATSIGTASPQKAEAARIDIRSADNVPLLDATIGRVLADAAQRSLGNTITESYLDNVYLSLGTMREQLGQAADGATQLADGSAELSKGTGQLKDGSGTLATKLGELAKGAGELATGADQAASGSAQLATGASQLDSGAAQLASGLNTLKSRTADLPSQAKQLADGAAQVAAGTQQIEDAADPALAAAITAIDNAPDATTAASRVRDLVAECDGSPDFCARLQSGIDPLMSDAGKLDSLKQDVRGKVSTARKDLNRLNTGAHQLADGNAQLAEAAGPLANGISDAAGGAAELSNGAKQVNDGAAQLKSGTAELAKGSHQLADGSKQAADGAKQLADGAVAADKGAKQVADGAQQLADGLNGSLKEIPAYSAADRDHLKQIVAAPVASDVVGADGYMNSAMALFAVLALWTAALVAFSMLRPMPRDIATSDRPSWMLALTGSLPGATVGAGAALVAAVVLAMATSATFPRFLMLLLATLVASAMFMVLNRALVAMAAAPGRLVSIIVLALTAATGITSAQPGLLQAIAPFLPTTAALAMFRNAVGGSFGPMWQSLIPLLFWLALGYLATLVLTERARSVTVRAVRPAVNPDLTATI